MIGLVWAGGSHGASLKLSQPPPGAGLWNFDGLGSSPKYPSSCEAASCMWDGHDAARLDSNVLSERANDLASAVMLGIWPVSYCA